MFARKDFEGADRLLRGRRVRWCDGAESGARRAVPLQAALLCGWRVRVVGVDVDERVPPRGPRVLL